LTTHPNPMPRLKKGLHSLFWGEIYFVLTAGSWLHSSCVPEKKWALIKKA